MSCYVSANWNKMLLNKVFWKIYAIRITKSFNQTREYQNTPDQNKKIYLRHPGLCCATGIQKR